MTIQKGKPEPVPLPILGAFSNATLAPNTITIKEPGFYSVNYSVYQSGVSVTPTELTFAVRKTVGPDIENIPETVSKAATSIGPFYASYIGDAIVQLPANAVLDIIIESTEDISMSLDPDTTSSLVVYKLN